MLPFFPLCCLSTRYFKTAFSDFFLTKDLYSFVLIFLISSLDRLISKSQIILSVSLAQSPLDGFFLWASYTLCMRELVGCCNMYWRRFNICRCTWYLAGIIPDSRYRRWRGQLLGVLKTLMRTDSSIFSNPLYSSSFTLQIVSAPYKILDLNKDSM